ncbi:MAG TPA: NfeD family protein [Mycobacteriales bacterium]|nr:NfeD family protein [Mycobacteriales bacterium]
MADWLLWLLAAGVLGVAEMLTLTLVLGMLAVAAAAAAVAAGLGIPAPVQVAVFAVVSVLLLGVARPVARRHHHTPASLQTGAAALVGRRATAVTDVDRDGGQVRIGGEVWTARPYDEHQVIPAGAGVDVVQIDGATAVVLPVDPA